MAQARSGAPRPHGHKQQKTPEWLVFLRTVCALAEGAAELVAGVPDAAAAACVLTVLGDPHRRVIVMGGRDGMPRSLGSVYAGSVTRFLGGFRGGFSRVIAMPGAWPVAVSRDGSLLVVSGGATNCHASSAPADMRLRILLHSQGAGPLQFDNANQVWIASDDFVFVADTDNNRIQILTPRHDFHAFVGVGQLLQPKGVCANDDVIVVSEYCRHCIFVFDRKTGAILRRFGDYGHGDEDLWCPEGLCFMSDHRHIAVWTVEGKFVRHLGAGKLALPIGIACSDIDELAVADWRNGRIVVLSTSDEIVWTSENVLFPAVCTSVAMLGNTIFGLNGGKCFVFA